MPALISGVARRLGDLVGAGLPAGAAGVAVLRTRLDLGAMMTLEPTAAGWELAAYNCPYRAVGQRFEEVCDLVPQVIGAALHTGAQRPVCQRDGALACHFSIARTDHSSAS